MSFVAWNVLALLILSWKFLSKLSSLLLILIFGEHCVLLLRCLCNSDKYFKSLWHILHTTVDKLILLTSILSVACGNSVALHVLVFLCLCNPCLLVNCELHLLQICSLLCNVSGISCIVLFNGCEIAEIALVFDVNLDITS